MNNRNKKPETRNKKRFFLPKSLFIIAVFVFVGNFVSAQYDANRYPVIPKPTQLLPFSGEFLLNAQTIIVTDNKSYRNEVVFFQKEVKEFFGLDLKFSNKKISSNFIYISLDSTDIPNEGYDLFVNRNEINIYGGHAGVFYALQSLFQLIHQSTGALFATSPYNVPSCSIVDQPRFSWRGMHLDVARHFFPKEDVKSYLRYMAMYKMNTFHWHLTDDQGWRIEIKKYPKLTEVGAWRDGTLIGHQGQDTPPKFDQNRYGGFYTQDDIREIVRFADSLHITIVPEIEMPGHSLAMLAAYPDLACTPGPFAVSKEWGVFEDVLCPTEHTFSFLDDVLKEVCALFPGKYIHIGGDECPKARWKESAFCQDLMKKNNLKDENELQSWFTQRIVKLLQQKGKQAMGWDEILEGGLADGAAVMSWRGEEGGIAAAHAKHNVVMSPGEFCYFDHYQSKNTSEPLAIGGYLPLEKVYAYDPVPSSLSADEKKYILGVQANVWTEYIPDFKQMQYMLFPRIAAEAEVAWDEPGNKNYDFFVKRLLPQFSLFDKMKINYAKSIFDIHSSLSSDENGLYVTLTTAKKGAKIFYTGYSFFDPKAAIEYTAPIRITDDASISAMVYYDSVPISHQFYLSLSVNKATGKPILLRKSPSPEYNDGSPGKLNDGQIGRMPWVGSDWLGWSGDTMDAMIDLQHVTSINSIRISTLYDPDSWIYTPGNFMFQVSDDGKTFTNPKQLLESEESSSRWHIFKTEGLNGRYIRIIVSGMNKIPGGSPGEGNPPWMFVDEIQVF